MKRLFLLFIITTAFFAACSNGNSKRMRKGKINHVEITDNKLLSNIKDYLNQNLNGVNFDFALILEVQEKDSLIDKMFYEMNLEDLYLESPPFYTLIDGNLVLINTKSARFNVKSQNSIDSIYSKAFPQQYDFLKKNGYFEMPITFSCDKWIFVNNVFVKKELY